jgi:hypothetical protein
MLLGNPLSPGGKSGVKETYLPAPQSVQDVAPVDAEYLPAAQLVHAAEPVTVLYCPAKQAVHGPPSGPENPALQTQAVAIVDAIGDCVYTGHAEQVFANVAPTAAEYVLAAQSVHNAEPVIVLYFPAVHDVHDPPFCPVNPRLHTQLVSTVDPATDCESVGQFEHELSAVAPADAEYLPAAHVTQSAAASLPAVSRYVPAAQLVHMDAPV